MQGTPDQHMTVIYGTIPTCYLSCKSCTVDSQGIIICWVFKFFYKINCVINASIVTGDSGYALRPWLITPISNAEEGTAECDFNHCQMSARSIVERVNGVLKTRFRCLLKHRVLHYSPETASKIINTCCVLHNLCVENNLDDVPAEQEGEEFDGIFDDAADANANEGNSGPARSERLLIEGRRFRESIVRNYFS